MNCIKWCARNLNKRAVKGKRVIEVGSYDVNGSPRYVIELLEPAEYIGVDVLKGPGVDVICSAENLVKRFGKESFDLVVSTCTLEHIRNWKESISNFKNVCKPNGLILVIVPSNWPFHEYPYDFWRYKKEDIKNIFSDCNISVLEEDAQVSPLRTNVYARVIKPKNFVEKDLSDYQLHSVIVGRRIRELQDKDLKSLRFKFLVFENKVEKGIAGLVKTVYSKHRYR